MTQAPKFKTYWLLKDAIGADKTDILEHEPTRHTIVDFVKVVDASYVEMLEAKLGKLKEVIIAKLNKFDQEMEGYSYFGSDPGVSRDDYNELADEVVKELESVEET